MITSRDLDLIGPAPARPGRPTPPQQAHPGDRPLRAAEVSAAAMVTVRGRCTRRVLEELTARVTALLEVGVRELVLDLSTVTDAGPRLPRAVRRLHQTISEHGGALTLAAAPPAASVGPAPPTTTPAQALLTSRSPRHPLPPSPPQGPIDQDPTDPGPTDPGPTDLGPSDLGLTAARPVNTPDHPAQPAVVPPSRGSCVFCGAERAGDTEPVCPDHATERAENGYVFAPPRFGLDTCHGTNPACQCTDPSHADGLPVNCWSHQ